ncbi:hypothetical protein BH11MYX1_BH11MYX1_48850 [soil metagenome]
MRLPRMLSIEPKGYPMSESRDPSVVELVDANVPADQGLAALGMLMQLAGNVFAAFVALFAFGVVFAMRGSGGSEALYGFLVLGLSIGRSLMQRSAGATLLYGDPNVSGARMRGVERYIAFGLVQSLLVSGICKLKFGISASGAIGMIAALALWPAVLAGLLALPRFKKFRTDLPITEDKGFEGASILMTVLGLCGVLVTGTALFMMFQMPGKVLQQGAMVIMALCLVLLFVRSIIHVHAGITGLQTTSVDRSVELANRYANFGVISAFCGGGALLLFVMSSAVSVLGLVIVCALCWMLIAWPMIIRRFFADRQFADLMAGDHAPVHRRAPDAGLTWLGWLLIAQAVFTMSLMLPGIFMGGAAHHEGSRGMGMDAYGMLGMLAAAGVRSGWWTVGRIGLQAWAGFELVRMSSQSRVIAMVSSVIGVAVTIYTNLPILESLRHGLGSRMMSAEAVAFAPIALALVTPIATIVLVNRKLAPVAQARFRTKP